jgi:hypothetical protein
MGLAGTIRRPAQPEPKSGNARERVPTAIGNCRWMPLRSRGAANESFQDRLHSIAHSARATARPDQGGRDPLPRVADIR